MPIFAATVFLSSFLLFAVQPMIAKYLLPSFGGSAGVWASCLVFFQILLLAGYAYAHLLRLKVSVKAQRFVHVGVLALALLFLPPAPHLPTGLEATARPVLELLRALCTSIAFPFFALSATAPLIMEWFRQRFPARTPDRLYAFSNAGSLLALLAYPALLEPNFTRGTQARLWAGGLCLFTVLGAVTGWKSLTQAAAPELPAKRQQKGKQVTPALAVAKPAPKWLWIALPACGSALLLALTNQISQDVAPMPLLWVAPLGVYLLTFILCFEGPRSYRRGFFLVAGFAALLSLAWLLDQGYLQGFWVQVNGYLLVLFFGCMVCHGELYRLRPPPEGLTLYYLCISLGGALGGVFVALIAPVVFKTLLETPIIAVAIAGLVIVLLEREPAKWRFAVSPGTAAIVGTVILAGGLGYVVYQQRTQSICFARSFYGAYRVKEGPTLLLDKVNYRLTPGPARVLLSGQIYHGLQFMDPKAAGMATAYFSDESGLGFAFREIPARTNRNIGVIGLGAGTIAAYTRAGDNIRFYEINPDVLRIARGWFTFLSNSPATPEVILGDGRLSLEREPDQNFDLFVLDAFAGDSIPLHLLTKQAMAIYARHVKPDGLIAFHISNSHLNLEPVVRALAASCGFQAVVVPPTRVDPKQGKLASVWMLVSRNAEFFRKPEVALLTHVSLTPTALEPLLWTDDYSSILPILR